MSRAAAKIAPSFTSGSRVSKAACLEVFELEGRDGRVDVGAVIAAARPKRSACHKYFTWDVKRAAEKCWRVEAMWLIRHVAFEQPAENGLMQVRYLVSLSSDREADSGTYRSVTYVLRNPEAREIMLADALAELKAFRSKYAHLTELVDVFEAVDRI
jgi:hypothetical protein